MSCLRKRCREAWARWSRSSSPAGKWLPDPATMERLAERLHVVAARIAEIDMALARPELSESCAVRRQAELTSANASEPALLASRLRLENIRRLRLVRDRFARELDEVRELSAQLVTQAEVTRLTGGTEGALTPLLHELSARIEGLEGMLREDPGALA